MIFANGQGETIEFDSISEWQEFNRERTIFLKPIFQMAWNKIDFLANLIAGASAFRLFGMAAAAMAVPFPELHFRSILESPLGENQEGVELKITPNYPCGRSTCGYYREIPVTPNRCVGSEPGVKPECKNWIPAPSSNAMDVLIDDTKGESHV